MDAHQANNNNNGIATRKRSFGEERNYGKKLQYCNDLIIGAAIDEHNNNLNGSVAHSPQSCAQVWSSAPTPTAEHHNNHNYYYSESSLAAFEAALNRKPASDRVCFVNPSTGQMLTGNRAPRRVETIRKYLSEGWVPLESPNKKKKPWEMEPSSSTTPATMTNNNNFANNNNNNNNNVSSSTMSTTMSTTMTNTSISTSQMSVNPDNLCSSQNQPPPPPQQQRQYHHQRANSSPPAIKRHYHHHIKSNNTSSNNGSTGRHNFGAVHRHRHHHRHRCPKNNDNNNDMEPSINNVTSLSNSIAFSTNVASSILPSSSSSSSSSTTTIAAHHHHHHHHHHRSKAQQQEDGDEYMDDDTTTTASIVTAAAAAAAAFTSKKYQQKIKESLGSFEWIGSCQGDDFGKKYYNAFQFGGIVYRVGEYAYILSEKESTIRIGNIVGAYEDTSSGERMLQVYWFFRREDISKPNQDSKEVLPLQDLCECEADSVCGKCTVKSWDAIDDWATFRNEEDYYFYRPFDATTCFFHTTRLTRCTRQLSFEDFASTSTPSSLSFSPFGSVSATSKQQQQQQQQQRSQAHLEMCFEDNCVPLFDDRIISNDGFDIGEFFDFGGAIALY